MCKIIKLTIVIFLGRLLNKISSFDNFCIVVAIECG